MCGISFFLSALVRSHKASRKPPVNRDKQGYTHLDWPAGQRLLAPGLTGGRLEDPTPRTPAQVGRHTLPAFLRKYLGALIELQISHSADIDCLFHGD